MRLHGYCSVCHRPRLVTVSGSALALSHARGGVPEGICSACEEGVEARRTGVLPTAHRGRVVHGWAFSRVTDEEAAAIHVFLRSGRVSDLVGSWRTKGERYLASL